MGDYVPSEYQHFPIGKIEDSYKKRLGELQSSKGAGSNTTEEERGSSLQLATASVPAHMENSARVEQGSHAKEVVQQAEWAKQADAVEAQKIDQTGNQMKKTNTAKQAFTDRQEVSSTASFKFLAATGSSSNFDASHFAFLA